MNILGLGWSFLLGMFSLSLFFIIWGRRQKTTIVIICKSKLVKNNGDVFYQLVCTDFYLGNFRITGILLVISI